MRGRQSDIPRVRNAGACPVAGGEPRELLENVVAADWTPDGSGMLAVIRSVPEATGKGKLEFPVGRKSTSPLTT